VTLENPSEAFGTIFLVVGSLVMAGLGAALLRRRGRLSGWLARDSRHLIDSVAGSDAAGRRVDPYTRGVAGGLRLFADESNTSILLGVSGLMMLVVGAAVVTLSLIGYVRQLDPSWVAPAQSALATAVVQPVPRGRSLIDVATAAVEGASTLDRTEARSISFAAVEVLPVCSSPAPQCRLDNPGRPVQAWAGRLRWEYRRPPDTAWSSYSCPAVATLTAEQGWQLWTSNSCFR
jgi:hypothetical protein